MAKTDQESLEQRLLGMTLGLVTAPVLLGLVAAQAGERWLRNLTFADQGWWLDQHLPPLDEAALVARDQIDPAQPPQAEQQQSLPAASHEEAR